ncbi:MAG: DNA internalization-related competence protein ComEC/Rec2 [Gemmatimonadaceae bacterium]
MPSSPPPIPLSAAAVTLYVAGLLAGFRGAVGAALVVAAVVLTYAALIRSITHAAVALVLAAGALTAQGGAVRGRRCEALLAVRREWLVELDDRATPGGFVRARSLEPGCRIPLRVAVDRGAAAPGEAVRVAGSPAPAARGLTVVRAAVRTVSRAGVLRRVRSRAAASIDSTFRRDAPLAKALLVADTKSLTPEVRERYAAAGLAHMLSISGLHVGLIAIALAVAAQVARLPPDAAKVATLAALALYIAVIGAPAPAVRAGIMLGAVTLSRLAQRPVSPWAVLALGAAGPLVDPSTATDLGYQLSVVGVVALVAADGLVRRLVADRVTGWRRTVVTALVGSTVASVVSLPIVAWTFGRVSVIAPLTNLVAAPIMAVAQPMLFLALLLGWAPAAARFVADATHPLLVAFDTVASVGATLPYATLEVAPTLATAALAAAAVAAFVAACVSRYPGRATVAGMALVAALAWLPVLPPRPGAAELHVIDVGQGDAVAMRTARGRWILVDAGRAWRGGDAGRTTVVPYLRRRGGDLEAFVLTHPHADHVGGAATVVRALRPRTFFDAAFAGAGDAYRAALVSAAEAGVRWQRVRPGDSIRVDDATITFLAPDSTWTASLADPNEASTVLMIRVGAVRFLLTGDAERGEEAWLVNHAGAGLRADVLKVAHHGSATSTTASFLDAVRPRVAVISVGAANIYGHPDPATVRALAAAGAHVLRTDHLGSIVVRTDGRRLLVHTSGEQWDVTAPSSPQ